MADAGKAEAAGDSGSCFTISRPAHSRSDAPAASSRSQLPPGMFGLMAVTTLATFGTLTGSYQLLF